MNTKAPSPPVLTGLQYDSFREVVLKIEPGFAMAVGPYGSPGLALSCIKEGMRVSDL